MQFDFECEIVGCVHNCPFLGIFWGINFTIFGLGSIRAKGHEDMTVHKVLFLCCALPCWAMLMLSVGSTGR